jgi:hypothetical protein
MNSALFVCTSRSVCLLTGAYEYDWPNQGQTLDASQVVLATFVEHSSKLSKEYGGGGGKTGTRRPDWGVTKNLLLKFAANMEYTKA